MKRKVGIVSLDFNNYNYGGTLQQVALEIALKKRGIDAQTFNIDIKNEHTIHYKTGGLLSLKHFVGKCLRAIKNIRYLRTKKFLKPRYAKFQQFKKDFYNNCKKIKIADIDTNAYDAFICGSDQIWQPSWARKSLFLDFVPDNKKKIIYAASIGRENLDHHDKSIYKSLIDRLDFVSVREKSAKNILDSFIKNKNIPVVLDPTLLLDTVDWENLASNDIKENNYVFTYFLTRNEDFNNVVKKFADSKKFKIFNISYATGSIKSEKNDFGNYNIVDAGPSQFLELIKKAKYVFTDSFHACVFSILFEKEFFVFDRKINEVSMLGRINTLLSYFDIKRVVNKDTNFDFFKKIDYSNKNKILTDLRKTSYEFLESSINTTTQKTVINSSIDCTGCGKCSKICPVQAISYTEDDYGFIKPKINDKICVKCGKCFNLCTQRQNFTKNSFNNGIYVLIKKIPPEEKTSSAGIFGQLAKHVISNDGVVYATVYNKNKSKYIRIDNLENIKEAYGSKYFQIDITEIIDAIKKDIDNNKKIMIVGTPCQIAGIKALYNNDNLILVSLVCHGAPSQKLFKDILNYEFNEIPSEVDFRFKSPAWDNFKIKYKLSNKTIETSLDQNLFMNLFLNEVILNDCCYNCHYAGKNFGADISIGDAWGLQHINKSMYNNSKCGASYFIANTPTGAELLKKICNDYFIYQVPKSKYKYVSQNIFNPLEIEEKRFFKHEYLREAKANGYKTIIRTRQKRTMVQKIKNKIKQFLKI